MNYLQATLEKIANCDKEQELRQIEHVVNHSSLTWSFQDKVVLNARISYVRDRINFGH
jgi:hypothetical protein